MTDLATSDGSIAAIEVVRVSVPKRSWKSEWRAIKIMWRREMIRFVKDRMRIVTSLVQPLLYLFVLGSGLNAFAGGGESDFNFKTFIFPGILCMTVMFTAMFSSMSIVWDREFGFLREMMVAPIRRSSIVIGKVLGGATVAGLQGLVMIVIAPLVDVPYSLPLILGSFFLMLLLAFAMTAFGVMIAARIKQMQSFMGIMQMIIMPMFFISGALYPVTGLPDWLAVLNRLDPITYAVDPMRKLVFNHIDTLPPQLASTTGVTWFGWTVPTALEIAIVAALGLAMLGVAIWEFRSAE
ncbi:MAG: ABC transporter permease [Thermoleophilaceae bacterium]|nr:ABC transporter permease [Thermoleophilaceae bacterium]